MENLVTHKDHMRPAYREHKLQPVAMDIPSADFEGKTLVEQAWLQYEYEREKRHPLHTRKWTNGPWTSAKKLEPRPSEPILTPRRDNYLSHDDFVHALRDYSLKINLIHHKAEKDRYKKTRGFVGKLLDQVPMMGQMAALYTGVHPRLVGQGLQALRDMGKLVSSASEMEELTDFYDLLPKNIYLDTEGHTW